MSTLASRIERNLGWIVLAILLGGCLLVLWPFVSALLWGVVLCYSTWPIYRRLLKLLGGRRTLAAAVMTLAMVLVVLLPFMIIGTTLADSVKELTTAARHSIEAGPPRTIGDDLLGEPGCRPRKADPGVPALRRTCEHMAVEDRARFRPRLAGAGVEYLRRVLPVP
jgi:hypothetical protein